MPGQNFPRNPGHAPEVRRMLKETTLGIREIARRIGVSGPYVSQVALREGLRKRREYRYYPNPWGLTARQFEVMQHLAQTGLLKLVGPKIGIQQTSVETHLHAAKKKLGERVLIPALLKFDRWHRDSVRSNVA